MNYFFDFSMDNPRECNIRITSRHYVHNIERFAKYGIVPSLFGSSDTAAETGAVDPEDFPDEMCDALDEILRLENEKFGAPMYVNDPYAPMEEDDVPEDYDGEDCGLSPIEDFNRKLEELAKLLSPDDGDDNALVFETRGTIERCIRDGRSVIEVRYDEDESMEGTETVIRYDPSRPHSAMIDHTGGVVSVLILEEGVRHITVYQTPIMPFEIAVYTKNCSGGFSDDGGILRLDYMLELRGADIQQTVMTIEVSPLGNA